MNPHPQLIPACRQGADSIFLAVDTRKNVGIMWISGILSRLTVLPDIIQCRILCVLACLVSTYSKLRSWHPFRSPHEYIIRTVALEFSRQFAASLIKKYGRSDNLITSGV
ncbi:hypothetical protein AG1IA_07933 [Rhizoctonia solani AG-1 IA]|uniref:Uncharacterized protein n=1 Tax=Thanatephorus cucumeris (strain AG1-IA) TaxID=983506 RepID=L8WIJ2_THACA|nr:hypothetical protein AG1IA_07933 [Rhizoctonia solani AG-1 IA]